MFTFQVLGVLVKQLGVEFDSHGKSLRHDLVTDLQCLLWLLTGQFEVELWSFPSSIQVTKVHPANNSPLPSETWPLWSSQEGISGSASWHSHEPGSFILISGPSQLSLKKSVVSDLSELDNWIRKSIKRTSLSASTLTCSLWSGPSKEELVTLTSGKTKVKKRGQQTWPTSRLTHPIY